MTLDHTSVVSLLYDLNRHRDGLFRFRYLSDNTTSPPWRLEEAFADDDGVQFRIEYTTGNRFDFFAILNGGQLVYSGIVLMTVRLAARFPQGGFSGSSADDSQCQQLDKNLRGVFS